MKKLFLTCSASPIFNSPFEVNSTPTPSTYAFITCLCASYCLHLLKQTNKWSYCWIHYDWTNPQIINSNLPGCIVPYPTKVSPLALSILQTLLQYCFCRVIIIMLLQINPVINPQLHSSYCQQLFSNFYL